MRMAEKLSYVAALQNGLANVYPHPASNIEALRIKMQLLHTMAKEFESKLAELQQCIDLALNKK